MEDVRWKQRFANFKKALNQLDNAVEIRSQRPLSKLEEQGMIKKFEYTRELAWNVMKDFLKYQGVNNIIGSRDATREAFSKGLIVDGDHWMEMIRCRNLTSHTYNEPLVESIAETISETFHPLFVTFAYTMESYE